MKATTPSAESKGARRAERKRRRAEQQRLEPIRRSRRVIGVLATIALGLAFVLGAIGQVVLGSVAVFMASALAGLWVGASIRLVRERRKIEHGAR